MEPKGFEIKTDMKKIVVTTDLSESSKAALKFAIQLSSQHEVKLIFFHAIELLIPTHWNELKAKTYMHEEIKKQSYELEQFVMRTYKQCRKNPPRLDCIVRYGTPVSQAIMHFAAEVGADYICISTRGAGRLKKLVGTHTSALIRRASVPVFAIPMDYRRSRIREILYASDFRALRDELRTVKGIAKTLESSISVLHFEAFIDTKSEKEIAEGIAKRNAGIKFHSEKFSLEETLDQQLKKAAKKFHADLVALFSDHKRSWIDRILLGSNSARASFTSSTPMLVYPK